MITNLNKLCKSIEIKKTYNRRGYITHNGKDFFVLQIKLENLGQVPKTEESLMTFIIYQVTKFTSQKEIWSNRMKYLS